MVSASSEARKQDCQSSQILLRSLYRAATLMKKRAQMIPAVTVAACILTIRGQKVILDSDLAAIYGVTPKRLNEQVKRNPRRFPPDFVFQLTKEEHAVLKSQIAIAKLGNLRSQFATSSSGYGGRRFLPYAFHRKWCRHGRQRPQQPASRAHECLCSDRCPMGTRS